MKMNKYSVQSSIYVQYTKSVILIVNYWHLGWHYNEKNYDYDVSERSYTAQDYEKSGSTNIWPINTKILF